MGRHTKLSQTECIDQQTLRLRINSVLMATYKLIKASRYIVMTHTKTRFVRLVFYAVPHGSRPVEPVVV